MTPKDASLQLQIIFGLQLNATKEFSRKVWVSYGVFIAMLSFLDEFQTVCLQSTNKFCYNIAVSRVQISLSTDQLVYFTWPNGGKLSEHIIAYSETTQIKLLQLEKQKFVKDLDTNSNIQSFEFTAWNSCQVGKNLIFQAYEGF